MADTRQHVLVVGPKQAGLDRVAPMLRRADFAVHTVEPSPFLHDLVLSTAFELVIVTYPLEEISLDQLMQTIRNDGSACHNAGLLLLAEPDRLDEAQSRVDLGANRAVCTDWNESRLWRAIWMTNGFFAWVRHYRMPIRGLTAPITARPFKKLFPS